MSRKILAHFQKAKKAFLARDYGASLQLYNDLLLQNLTPVFEKRAKIGVLLSDIAFENEEQAQKLFEYHQILRLQKIKDCDENILHIIELFDKNANHFAELVNAENAVELSIDNVSKFKVRMIDCVGYIVPSSEGYFEDEQPRMVMTPWSDEEIPFNLAAEIGTKKVIEEHSTIGLVVTTDGSISQIPRSEYADAEKRVVDELTAIIHMDYGILGSSDLDQASPFAAKLQTNLLLPFIYSVIRDGQFKSRFLQKRLQKRQAEMGDYVKAFMGMLGGARPYVTMQSCIYAPTMQLYAQLVLHVANFRLF